jgi:hypothetical protein
MSIFDEFVTKAYEAKSKAPRDTPKYTSAKTKMNALTGKFAQRFAEEGLIFVRKQSELAGIEFYNLTTVNDSDGRILGFMASIKNYTPTACYPVHLSSFILGHSRCFMSRILRNMNATTEPQDSPIYSDTDSYIINKRVFLRLPAKRLGKKLGQLKPEVNGKIIHVCALAPKTYRFIYVDAETLEVKCQTRCKGISHTPEAYDAFDDCVASNPEEAIEHYEIHQNKEDMSGADIRERKYFFFNQANELMVTDKIPGLAFPKLLTGELRMELLWGGMERNLDYSNLETISIAPTYKTRTIYKTPWWQSNKRIYKSNHGAFDYAYPPGHKDLVPQE